MIFEYTYTLVSEESGQPISGKAWVNLNQVVEFNQINVNKEVHVLLVLPGLDRDGERLTRLISEPAEVTQLQALLHAQHILNLQTAGLVEEIPNS